MYARRRSSLLIGVRTCASYTRTVKERRVTKAQWIWFRQRRTELKTRVASLRRRVGHYPEWVETVTGEACASLARSREILASSRPTVELRLKSLRIRVAEDSDSAADALSTIAQAGP